MSAESMSPQGPERMVTVVTDPSVSMPPLIQRSMVMTRVGIARTQERRQRRLRDPRHPRKRFETSRDGHFSNQRLGVFHFTSIVAQCEHLGICRAYRNCFCRCLPQLSYMMNRRRNSLIISVDAVFIKIYSRCRWTCEAVFCAIQGP